MKRPNMRDLLKVNASLKSQSLTTYLTILRQILNQYHELTGDGLRPLGYLRGKQYYLLYKWCDSLSGQKYPDAKSTYLASQIVALIKKYPWPSDLLDLGPRETAIATFEKSERKCAKMNRKFKLLHTLRDPFALRTNFLRKTISSIIGDKPQMREVYEACDFGGGASIGIHGSSTHLGQKLTKSWTCTPCARDYASAALKHNYHYSVKLFPSNNGILCFDIEAWEGNLIQSCKLVSYNKISFVPKTAKTHRAIAVEPLLNGFLQKGADLVLRRKLLELGIDLRDQSINSELARKGSLRDDEDSFITIDLSSASDSISCGLVKHLLPYHWYDFLQRIRSPSYMLDGKLETYHKFCSMGNGFCFPLQTLLFVALCITSGAGKPQKDFSVYGDDIIVRKKYANEVLSLLRYYGFTPNTGKTFLSGPFRESCGSDWYLGEDVRPFTLDFPLDSVQNLFKFLNLCRRNSRFTLLFEPSFEYILNLVPTSFRFIRPFMGPPDAGIDPLVDLTYTGQAAGTSWNKRYQCLSWYELHTRSKYDCEEYPPWVVLAGLVNGRKPLGKNLFTFRRKTETVVRLVARSGSTC